MKRPPKADALLWRLRYEQAAERARRLDAIVEKMSKQKSKHLAERTAWIIKNADLHFKLFRECGVYD